MNKMDYKQEVKKEIKKKDGNLYPLYLNVLEWAESSMAEHPVTEEKAIMESNPNIKEVTPQRIAIRIMKELVENYEEYKEQTKDINLSTEQLTEEFKTELKRGKTEE